MKYRRAGLAIVLFCLAVFSVASGNHNCAVIDPRATVTWIDSMQFLSPDTTFLTPDWGRHLVYDTFPLPDYLTWPDTIVLHGMVQGFEVHTPFTRYRHDTWYPISLSIATSYVLFYACVDAEEPEPVIEHSQRLAISPSVVTGQMTVRLQPICTRRPVVEIHDAVGNVVRTLGCATGADGVATATWNREDKSGRLVPKGVYFCRYASADVISVRKVLVAR
jgi:hypothetical protein